MCRTPKNCDVCDEVYDEEHVIINGVICYDNLYDDMPHLLCGECNLVWSVGGRQYTADHPLHNVCLCSPQCPAFVEYSRGILQPS